MLLTKCVTNTKIYTKNYIFFKLQIISKPFRQKKNSDKLKQSDLLRYLI